MTKEKEVNAVSTGSQPFVSVVTPVYNMGAFLSECIESVLKQTYGNFEYIIVNNCSTDHTHEIALAYAKKDNRIKVHDEKEFVGVIENHNRAFRLISPESKYCKVVSADDWIFPDCLEQLVRFAEANPSVGIVGSYLLVGKKIMCTGLEYERKVVSGAQICRETLLGDFYVFGAPTTLLYRSDLVRRSREFYPGTSPHADTTACYQWLKYCDFGFVHQVLSYTRIHAASQTSASIKSGVIRLSTIGDLVRCGPEYLNKEELKRRLKYLINNYYDFLVSVIVRYLCDRDFRKRQKVGLRELGLHFNQARLCRAIVIKGCRLLLNPGKAIRRIFAIKSEQENALKTEATYY